MFGYTGWAAVLSGETMRYTFGGGHRVMVGDTPIEVWAQRKLGLKDTQTGLFYLTEDVALQRLDELIEEGKNQE